MAITVVSVDDNAAVSDAIRTVLHRADDITWLESLDSTRELLPCVERHRPEIVLLDIDIPGENTFEALDKLSNLCPWCRVIVYTGHARGDLINRALDGGAWGYVSKSDGVEELVRAIRSVALGDVVISLDARQTLDSLGDRPPA